MEEPLKMSQKERTRLGIMQQVQAEQMPLVTAAQVLGLSYRQVKRIWRRYQQSGDAGLVHAGRGRASNRAKEKVLKARVLARYAKRYPDFGPTLAVEHLAKEGLAVDHETLAGPRQLEHQAAPSEASAMEGTQSLFWAARADGRLAS